MEAFGYEVSRKLYLSANTEIDVLPALDLIQVYPELRLRDEDEVCALPWTSLTPEIEESTE